MQTPSLEEIDYRTRLANCEALELKVKREQFELDNKRGELCRIDTALAAFDGFLREFVGFLDTKPYSRSSRHSFSGSPNTVCTCLLRAIRHNKKQQQMQKTRK